MTTVEGMTQSQEPRVSSSQDSLRLSEESISMPGASTNSAPRLLHLSDDCGCSSQSARHLSNHSIINSSIPNASSNLSIPQGVTALVNKLNSCTSAGEADDEKSAKDAEPSSQKDKIEEIFPWMRHFNHLCRKAVGTKSIKCLENLLTIYLQHVAKNVKDCYMKPNRAFKLKKCMNESLVFFHMFYQDLREPFEHAFYLSKMTDLVAMYLDMEIKASRRRKETIKRVISRLTSALYILLDKSEDHIMEAILKTTLINKSSKELCVPILGKILTTLPVTPSNDSYVRFVLAFKLWKKIVSDSEERRRITRLADQRLNVPLNFDKSKRYSDVLPRIPKSKKNITVFYMQAKFNLKDACGAFLKLSKTEKPLLDTEEISEKTTAKPDEVGGVRSMNLFNNLWSIINVPDSGLVESSQLNKVTGEKTKVDSVTGKKGKLSERKNKKAKKKIQKDGKEGAEGKVKKKKKFNKKKAVPNSGVAQSVLGTILGSKNVKEQKKKKKKLIALETPVGKDITVPKETTSPVTTNSVPEEVIPPTLTSQPTIEGSQEALSSTENQVVIKAESGQDLCIVAVVGEAGQESEQGSNQVNQINSVSYFGESVLVDMKENLEDTIQAPIPTSTPQTVVEVEMNESMAVPANQVNQVSMSMETEGAEATMSGEVENNDLGLAEKLRICDTPQLVNSERMTPEQMNQINSSKETPPPKDVDVCNVDKSENVGSKSIVIASSSDSPVVNSPVVNFLLNASQNRSAAVAAAAAAATVTASTAASSSEIATAVVENEAVPTVVNTEALDKPSTDVAIPRVTDQPTLEAVSCQETTVAASAEVLCDSSVRPEVPIPEEGSVGVDHDYFNSLPMEYDSDVEILADLRPQVTGQNNRSEVVVKDERDVCQDPSTVLDNIFATENEALVTEVLGGLYPPMDIESRTVRCESDISGLQSPSLCDDEGTELESPPVERFNEEDKLSMSMMMHHLIKGNSSYNLLNSYERERPDQFVQEDQLLLYRDTLLSENSISRYGLSHNRALTDDRFMEDDDSDDGSCFEENYNSSGSSGRLRMGGGKVGFHNYTTALNDKDLPDVSPTSSVESAVLNSTCVESRESSFISTADQSPQERPRTGQKIPAPGLSRMSPFPTGTPTVSLTPINPSVVVSTASSQSATPTKRFSDVNTLRYYTPSLATSDKQETPKRPSRLLASDAGKSETETRNTKERYNQQKSSPAGGFPDVVLDAHKSSEKQDKGASTPVGSHRTTRGTLLSDLDNGKSSKRYPSVPGYPISAAPTIPFPLFPFPNSMLVPFGRYRICTCSDCYKEHLSDLARQGGSTSGAQQPSSLTQVPKYADVDRSDYQAVLKEIEESLDPKYKVDEDSKDDLQLDIKYKPDLHSSLPLKKRLKTLACIEKPKIKNEVPDSPRTTQAECFPSYSSRPMISVAELEWGGRALCRLQREVPGSVRRTMIGEHLYPQYTGPTDFFNNGHSRDASIKHICETISSTCYNPSATRETVTCKTEENVGMYSCGRDRLSILSDVALSSSLAGTEDPNRTPHFSERYPIHEKPQVIPQNIPGNTNALEHTGRQFKTPAQLKEMVPTSKESNLVNINMNPVVPLTPLSSDMTMRKFPASSSSDYSVPSQDMSDIPQNVNNKMETVTRQQVLDLSKQASKEKVQKTSRKKRNSGSESRSRSSKRSKRDSVIHSSEKPMESPR